MPNEPKTRRSRLEIALLSSLLVKHLRDGGTPKDFATEHKLGESNGWCYKLAHKLGWAPMFVSKKEREILLKRRAK